MPWASSLQTVAVEFHVTWRALCAAAENAEIRLSEAPVLPLHMSHPRTQSDLRQMQALRYYRAQLASEENSHIINYAAGIAATQTHVGGTGSWGRSGACAGALLYGPAGGPIAFSTQNAYPRQRFSNFLQLFDKTNPLAGFPVASDWSLSAHAERLLSTPLAGGSREPFSAMTLASCYARLRGRTPSFPWFIARVRDLPIIRPRVFGTIEFRSDPAQPNPDAVVASAALRLGIVAAMWQYSRPSPIQIEGRIEVAELGRERYTNLRIRREPVGARRSSAGAKAAWARGGPVS